MAELTQKTGSSSGNFHTQKEIVLNIYTLSQRCIFYFLSLPYSASKQWLFCNVRYWIIKFSESLLQQKGRRQFLCYYKIFQRFQSPRKMFVKETLLRGTGKGELFLLWVVFLFFLCFSFAEYSHIDEIDFSPAASLLYFW